MSLAIASISSRAARGGSAARVTAEATATRFTPSDTSDSSRSAVMPPIAKVGRDTSPQTVRRNSGGACSANDFVGDVKQGPMPR